MKKYIYTSFDCICPYIRNVGSGNIPWNGTTRKIYDHQFMYFCKGIGEYRVSDKRYSITPGTIILIKPDMPHTILIDGEYKYLWVHFDFFYREDVKRMHDYVQKHKDDLFSETLIHNEWIREQPIFQENFLLPDHMQLEEKEIMEKLFTKLLFEFRSGRINSQIECKAILLQILSEIIHQIFEVESASISSPNYRIIYKLIQFIEQNYYKRVSLKDMADSVKLSSDYMSRILKKETGYTAIEYLNQYRIKKAKDLLMYNDLKISDVAEMVGFKSIQYFSEVFKKYEGISPRDFCKLFA